MTEVDFSAITQAVDKVSLVNQAFAALGPNFTAAVQQVEDKSAAVSATLQGTLIPGIGAVNQAMDKLANLGPDLAAKFPNLTQAIKDGQTAWQATTDTVARVSGAWSSAKDSIDTIKEGYNNAQERLGALHGGLKAVEQNALPGFIGKVQSASSSLVRFSKAPVSSTLGGLSQMGSAMLAMAGGAIKTLVSGLRILGLALVSNPVGLLIAAIAVAAGLIYKFWEPIKAFMGGVVEGFKSAAGPIKQVFEPLMPIFEAVGNAIGWVIEKISGLFEPISSTSEELDAVAEAGRGFGEFLAKAIQLALTPLDLLLKGLSAAKRLWNWAFGDEDKKEVTLTKEEVSKPGGGRGRQRGRKAPALASAKKIAQQAEQSGKVIPITQGYAAKNTRAAQRRPLRAGGNAVNVQNKSEITVVQQPGEDGEALARRVVQEEMKMQERQNQTRQRGALYDYQENAIP